VLREFASEQIAERRSMRLLGREDFCVGPFRA
jgi:hypothetical protein